MSKILLRRVAGFNRDQLLDQLSSFWTLEVEPPLSASFLVSHLPMSYPNVTKQKIP